MPEPLHRHLAELREAGRALRARSPGERIDKLAAVLDGWRDPASAWRRELEAELPAATGFSAENVKQGLRLALESWSGDALRELVRSELDQSLERGDILGFDTTAVVLAGSIPMPTLLSLLAPLVLGSPVLAKCASRDPITPRLVARSLAETDAGLGACLALLDFRRDDAASLGTLFEAECSVATGSDETLAALRARLPAGRRFVEYGHRVSMAALGPEALTGAALDDVARRLALDIALWDQLGCCSPVAVCAVGPSGGDALAGALARELAALERVLPRGEVEPGAAAAGAHERAAAELRGAAGAKVSVRSGDGWTVVLEDTAAPRPAPLHRFVRVLPMAAASDLMDAIAPWSRQLACVALEGFGSGSAELAGAIARLGASRVCAPGRLQAPPLAWPRDGQPVLLPLARLTASELPG